MNDQLPVPVSRKTALAKERAAPQFVVPALIADLGEQSSWRYTEFFSASISNPNTCRAFRRACLRFLSWCDERGVTLTQIRPHDVATYIADGLPGAPAPNVKQQLTAIRMPFDWLVNWPDDAEQSGSVGSQSEVCREDRQNTRAGKR